MEKRKNNKIYKKNKRKFTESISNRFNKCAFEKEKNSVRGLIRTILKLNKKGVS